MERRIHTFFAVALACVATGLAGPAQASAQYAAEPSAACPNQDLIPTAENLQLIREAVICVSNEVRRKAHVERLTPDARLEKAAAGHASDMVAQGYFAHEAPSGLHPFLRMRRAGYIGPRVVWNAGETIAWASGTAATPRSVVDAWMKETTQRLMLLAPDFRHIGVGIALGAPVARPVDAAPAVTYTVDYGWRTTKRALRRCLRQAERRARPVRRSMRAKCHGLGRVAAKVG